MILQVFASGDTDDVCINELISVCVADMFSLKLDTSHL